VKNQLHGLAMSQGVCRKKKLFTAQGREDLEKTLARSVGSRRRQELLGMLDQLNPVIDELDRAVRQEARAARTPLVDDPSGRRSGNRTGLRVDVRAGGTLPAEQTGGELSGTESEGTFQRRQAAHVRDQQAGPPERG